MNRKWFAVLVAAVLLGFVAPGVYASMAVVEQRLVGTWTVVESGYPFAPWNVVTFNANGTFSVTGQGAMNGRWAVSGDGTTIVLFNADNNVVSDPRTIHISPAGTMLLHDPRGGFRVTLVRN